MNIFAWATLGPGILNEYGRGECRWVCNVLRVLANAGHKITMYPVIKGIPESEKSKYRTVTHQNLNVIDHRDIGITNIFSADGLKKAREFFQDQEFDLGFYPTMGKTELFWTTKMVKTKKVIWGGIVGAKVSHEQCRGYYTKDEAFVRWFRPYLKFIPPYADFMDRNFLLAQPFGDKIELGKFDNKRIAITIKFPFLGFQEHVDLNARFLHAAVDACRETGSGLTIFNSTSVFNPSDGTRENLAKYGIMEKLSTLKDVILVPDTDPLTFNEKLRMCSVAFPIKGLPGSLLEAIFGGLTPLVFKDSFFMDHPAIAGVADEMTEGQLTENYSQEQMREKFVKLLTDRTYYDYFGDKIRPVVFDNTDQAVIEQFNCIMAKLNST